MFSTHRTREYDMSYIEMVTVSHYIGFTFIIFTALIEKSWNRICSVTWLCNSVTAVWLWNWDALLRNWYFALTSYGSYSINYYIMWLTSCTTHCIIVFFLLLAVMPWISINIFTAQCSESVFCFAASLCYFCCKSGATLNQFLKPLLFRFSF